MQRVCNGHQLCNEVEMISGEGNGTPLQYSCLENPMDGEAWWTAVHGVAKSRTQLGDFTFFSFFLVKRSKSNTGSY